ncbi:MAG: hypothetical protein ACTSUE_09090 [Promethearchaeota archaeon]
MNGSEREEYGLYDPLNPKRSSLGSTVSAAKEVPKVVVKTSQGFIGSVLETTYDLVTLNVGLSVAAAAYLITFIIINAGMGPAHPHSTTLSVPKSGWFENGNSAQFVFHSTHARWQAYIWEVDMDNSTNTYMEQIPKYVPEWDEYCFNWGNTAEEGSSYEVDHYKVSLHPTTLLQLEDDTDVIAEYPTKETRDVREKKGKLSVHCFISEVNSREVDVYKIELNRVSQTLTLVPFLILGGSILSTLFNLESGLSTLHGREAFVDVPNHLIRMVAFPFMAWVSAYWQGNISYNDHIVWALLGFAVAYANYVYQNASAVGLNKARTEEKLNERIGDGKLREHWKVINQGHAISGMTAISAIASTVLTVTLIVLLSTSQAHLDKHNTIAGENAVDDVMSMGKTPYDLWASTIVFMVFIGTDWLFSVGSYFFAMVYILLGRGGPEYASGEGHLYSLLNLNTEMVFFARDIVTAFFIILWLSYIHSALNDNNMIPFNKEQVDGEAALKAIDGNVVDLQNVIGWTHLGA